MVRATRGDTRVANEYIVITDLRGFTAILETSPMTTVEMILDALLELATEIAREFGGTIRFSAGDGHCLTFLDVGAAMAAAERLAADWAAFERQQAFRCPMSVVVHQGVLYAFRSYFYGPGLNVAGGVQGASQRVLSPDEGSICVTGEVRSLLAGTVWNTRLEPLDVGSASPRLARSRSTVFARHGPTRSVEVIRRASARTRLLEV